MNDVRADSNVLEVSDLQVHFNLPEGLIKAVDGISFQIPKGRTVALVGESGSGKSVVSQAIMGILPRLARIAGGEILFRDPQKPQQPAINIAALPQGSPQMRQLQGGRISIIFQEPMTSLSPLHTIGNQITESLQLHRHVSDAEGNELATDMLRLVGFPDPQRAMRTFAFELSGGLRQRAMIAMALVCRPALLIADEPTTALDVTIQAQILKLLKDLQSELGMAILMITHDLGVVANMADEIVVMYHGKVMERGGLHDIFEQPQHPYLKALLKAVPRFDMEPGERLVPIREIKGEVGTLLRSGRNTQASAMAGEPLLEVDHVSKSFTLRKGGLFGGGKLSQAIAVDDVSFTVLRGECLGLVGESGCGKTTTSKLVMRAMTPDSGSIRFHDGDKLVDVHRLEDDALFRYRRKVQFIFQDPFSSLNPRMTVFDIVSEPLVIHGIGDEDERFERVKELMTLVGLDPRFLRRYPHSFSGGQRQRIGIARALALQPDLLICDEPVSALDVSIQAQILNLLKDLKSELGLTYLFISHNLAVVDYIADRIAVMCAGRLVEIAPRDQLFSNPVHPYTKALLAAVPKPDPSSRLDLRLLMEGKASNPQSWPRPFTIDGGSRPHMIEVGRGHLVRAADTADFRDLVA
ncbi:MAG: dipeptide ABC transporter ATP-binding protein [Ferrovibrio sp.]|uniref:ABC transporter ATP-binding protein n=1 Tax=Ferrovibrio sp. TaxID=1917215 RepID=UPI0039199B8A